ncbi:response regulator transcription factor [Acidisoma sp. 7E03]
MSSDILLETTSTLHQTQETAPTPSGSFGLGIVYAHGFLRDCLVNSLVASLPRAAVIQTFGTVEEAADACRPPTTVLLVYLDGSFDSGMAAAVGDIADKGIRVVILVDDPSQVQRPALQAAVHHGLAGLVLTMNCSARLLAAAISFVANGGIYMTPEILLHLEAGPRALPKTPGRKPVLSLRQGQVLEKIREGKPNKVISYELGMTESTVKVHVGSIMKKLGARNRVQAVVLAGR